MGFSDATDPSQGDTSRRVAEGVHGCFSGCHNHRSFQQKTGNGMGILRTNGQNDISSDVREPSVSRKPSRDKACRRGIATIPLDHLGRVGPDDKTTVPEASREISRKNSDLFVYVGEGESSIPAIKSPPHPNH